MNIINPAIVRINLPKVALPEYDRFKTTCLSNNQKVTNFYKKHARYFGGEHFLYKLVSRLYSFFSDSPENTYRNLKGADMQIAYNLKLGGVSDNQEPQNIFLGEDYIICAFNQENLDADSLTDRPIFNKMTGELENSDSLTPARFIYHDAITFLPLSPNSSKREVDGRTVLLLDVPMLGAILHQAYLELDAEDSTTLMERRLIGELFYARTYLSYLDMVVLNRLVYLSYSFGDTDGGFASMEQTLTDMGFKQTDLGALFNRTFKLLLEAFSKKSSMDVGTALAAIPSFTEPDMRHLVVNYETWYSPTLEWGRVLNQKHFIEQLSNVLIGVGSELDDKFYESQRKTQLNPGKAKMYSASLAKKHRPWLNELFLLD